MQKNIVDVPCICCVCTPIYDYVRAQGKQAICVAVVICGLDFGLVLATDFACFPAASTWHSLVLAGR